MAHKYNSLPTGEYDEEKGKPHSALRYDTRLKEQDNNLDLLGASVARLGEISLNISEEINSQNKMLSRLETDMETAEDKVGSLTQKTKELIKKSGGKKNFCLILTLMIVLMILTFLVIYT